MQQGVQVHRSIMRPPVLPANLNRQGAMMANEWLDKAQQILNKWAAESNSIASMKIVNENANDDGRKLRNLIAEALRQEHDDAAAESRRNAIEKSAELIGRQVEPRDA